MPPQRRALAAQRTLGRRIRELRQQRGWTIEQLAEHASLDWTYVGQVERGRRNLSLHSLLALARGLGVAIADLVRDI
ncbi:MAG: helix-turn-helix domain-containing protein [Terriglobales bacterium]